MLNYLKKFAIEIVPSVAATVIGAYIVNHYINAKPAAEPPAAAMSTAQPKSDANQPDAGKARARPDSEIAGAPASGVKAKGISEKALLEKNAAAEKAVVIEKPAEKASEKPAETTASLPPEVKRPAPVRAAKAPAPLQPVIAAAPPAEASAAEDRRDANDLARAAIERLRGNGEAQPRVQTAPRAPEVTVHAPDEPRAATALPSTVRPLPPPIMVAAPPEATDPVVSRVDPSRPTPPAEIPVSRPPLDLRAEVEPPKQKANVAEEMLLAAKSMFHSVLPK